MYKSRKLNAFISTEKPNGSHVFRTLLALWYTNNRTGNRHVKSSTSTIPLKILRRCSALSQLRKDSKSEASYQRCAIFTTSILDHSSLTYRCLRWFADCMHKIFYSCLVFTGVGHWLEPCARHTLDQPFSVGYVLFFTRNTNCCQSHLNHLLPYYWVVVS